MTGMLVAALWCCTAAASADEVVYDIEVTLNWSEDTALSPPDDAHWSRLIAFAHSGRYTLFRDGDTASSGLALVATNGRVTVLEAEVAEAARRGRAAAPVILPGTDAGRGTFEFTLVLSEKHDQVSFATMLAPSPDWFSGVSNISLKTPEGWRENLTVPLWVWDAGADSGQTYSGPNLPTQPRQSIRLLTHPAFLQADGLRPIGRAVFSRVSP
ncbi:spondin domain-containing protein [uncultured Roseobacter sp.]|uniref:spondin domain-containing protein n=1 Tax=uncultured Roseobacter sp. TaxID=114847 RepID=UPI002610DFEF|nr:spondin domain-containing protein [uncultured Roseobacter sp.]